MIRLRESAYLSLMMILAPLINFISGISIDLYAPSMPAIAIYFHTTQMAVQNTIGLFVIGWAVGCILWGILFDVWGRKPIILSVVVIFVVTSLVAAHSRTISELMIIRFIQGMSVAAMSVGCRALIADHFTGRKLTIAVIYSSLAYGIGPVIAPFIGGYLQDIFGWQANFYAFAICGSVMLLLIALLVQERFKKPLDYSLQKVASFYKTVFSHKIFLSGCVVIGLSQLEIMIYPTVGSFLVERQLHHTAIVYGNSATIAGIGYFAGAIANRLLLRFFAQRQLMNIGFSLMVLSLFLQMLFVMYAKLSLLTLVLPVTVMCFANGFVGANVMSSCLKFFQKNASVATAAQIFALMTISGLGVFLISSLVVSSLFDLLSLFVVTVFIQIAFYNYGFKHIFSVAPEDETIQIGASQ